MSPDQKKYFEKQIRKNKHIPGRLAKNRFVSSVLATDAEKYVFDKLQSNLDLIFKDYNSNSHFKTYFTIKVQKLLGDFTKNFVYNHKDFLLSLSQKIFNDIKLADEACKYTLDQFEKNDWQIIRLFSGNTNFCEYLSEISNRFLMDFPGYKVCLYTDFIDNLSKKQFNDKNMADEAYLYVLERLEKSNWKKIHAYNGKISFKNYLAKWVKFLLIDYYRKVMDPGIFPEKLKKQKDPVLRLVYEYLCMKRLSDTDIIEHLNIMGYHQKTVNQLIKKISHDYPDCFKVRKKDISFEIQDQSDFAGDAEKRMISKESEGIIADLVKVFVSIFTDTLIEADQPLHDKDVMNIRKKLINEFKPDSAQREFLEMIYKHKISIKDAAKKLNWSLRKAYRQKDQLTNQIRNIIGEQNIKKFFKNNC